MQSEGQTGEVCCDDAGMAAMIGSCRNVNLSILYPARPSLLIVTTGNDLVMRSGRERCCPATESTEPETFAP